MYIDLENRITSGNNKIKLAIMDTNDHFNSILKITKVIIKAAIPTATFNP